MSSPWFALFAGTLALLAAAPVRAAASPNIVLILADDLGFSDIGCYGGEIATPNLDRLAAGGLRFTRFYNCAKCETTRATLLTGRYHHEVGIAKLANAATLAEVARGAGYTTLMAGKWHMNGNPLDRGFDRYFGHLSGACNYFTGDNTFRVDREVYEVPASGFYTTDADTDWALRFIREADPGRPLFLYLAYNAPHYPLQAPEAEVRKYLGKYRPGWDVLQQQRLARQREMKLLPRDYPLPPRPADVPAWDSLTEQEHAEHDLTMATFAAMVEHVDRGVGRLVEDLERNGELDNTLILFLSDNGACYEWGPFGFDGPSRRGADVLHTGDGLREIGQAGTWQSYGSAWANLGNTPLNLYKHFCHEGGISSPLIAHWPGQIAPHAD
ncbi:MAG: sulfatase-like hydrolase/transferase, partial [Verrucomicrobiae bacterium]|nr:sulfatase-like hydrolase/transferase [Verrucomicrobiae bacterium]